MQNKYAAMSGLSKSCRNLVTTEEYGVHSSAYGKHCDKIEKMSQSIGMCQRKIIFLLSFIINIEYLCI
jgi:hypothetical protein